MAFPCFFHGEDPNSWLSSMEEFFEVFQISMEYYVEIAVCYLKGEADKWAKKNEQLISKKDWCAFSYNLLWEFDPTIEVPTAEELLVVQVKEVDCKEEKSQILESVEQNEDNDDTQEVIISGNQTSIKGFDLAEKDDWCTLQYQIDLPHESHQEDLHPGDELLHQSGYFTPALQLFDEIPARIMIGHYRLCIPNVDYLDFLWAGDGLNRLKTWPNLLDSWFLCSCRGSRVLVHGKTLVSKMLEQATLTNQSQWYPFIDKVIRYSIEKAYVFSVRKEVSLNGSCWIPPFIWEPGDKSCASFDVTGQPYRGKSDLMIVELGSQIFLIYRDTANARVLVVFWTTSGREITSALVEHTIQGLLANNLLKELNGVCLTVFSTTTAGFHRQLIGLLLVLNTLDTKFEGASDFLIKGGIAMVSHMHKSISKNSVSIIWLTTTPMNGSIRSPFVVYSLFTASHCCVQLCHTNYNQVTRNIILVKLLRVKIRQTEKYEKYTRKDSEMSNISFIQIFDLSLLTTKEGMFAVKASARDIHLGGAIVLYSLPCAVIPNPHKLWKFSMDGGILKKLSSDSLRDVVIADEGCIFQNSYCGKRAKLVVDFFAAVTDVRQGIETGNKRHMYIGNLVVDAFLQTYTLWSETKLFMQWCRATYIPTIWKSVKKLQAYTHIIASLRVLSFSRDDFYSCILDRFWQHEFLTCFHIILMGSFVLLSHFLKVIPMFKKYWNIMKTKQPTNDRGQNKLTTYKHMLQIIIKDVNACFSMQKISLLRNALAIYVLPNELHVLHGGNDSWFKRSTCYASNSNSDKIKDTKELTASAMYFLTTDLKNRGSTRVCQDISTRGFNNITVARPRIVLYILAVYRWCWDPGAVQIYAITDSSSKELPCRIDVQSVLLYVFSSKFGFKRGTYNPKEFSRGKYFLDNSYLFISICAACLAFPARLSVSTMFFYLIFLIDNNRIVVATKRMFCMCGSRKKQGVHSRKSCHGPATVNEAIKIVPNSGYLTCRKWRASDQRYLRDSQIGQALMKLFMDKRCSRPKEALALCQIPFCFFVLYTRYKSLQYTYPDSIRGIIIAEMSLEKVISRIIPSSIMDTEQEGVLVVPLIFVLDGWVRVHFSHPRCFQNTPWSGQTLSTHARANFHKPDLVEVRDTWSINPAHQLRYLWDYTDNNSMKSFKANGIRLIMGMLLLYPLTTMGFPAPIASHVLEHTYAVLVLVFHNVQVSYLNFYYEFLSVLSYGLQFCTYFSWGPHPLYILSLVVHTRNSVAFLWFISWTTQLQLWLGNALYSMATVYAIHISVYSTYYVMTLRLTEKSYLVETPDVYWHKNNLELDLFTSAIKSVIWAFLPILQALYM